MSEPLRPREPKQVEEAIAWALAQGKTFELIGCGTKRPIGRAAQWDATLDLSALTGVTLYEPEELVLSAKAGTPLAEVEALTAASGQELAFEPMDYGPLLGVAAGAGTIGGTLAANLSGPRRIKAGAARDHFLGATAVFWGTRVALVRGWFWYAGATNRGLSSASLDAGFFAPKYSYDSLN